MNGPANGHRGRRDRTLAAIPVAVGHVGLAAQAQATLLVLLSFTSADQLRPVYPCQATIAARLGLGVRQTRRWLALLEREGWIIVKRSCPRRADGGRWWRPANWYVVCDGRIMGAARGRAWRRLDQARETPARTKGTSMTGVSDMDTESRSLRGTTGRIPNRWRGSSATERRVPAWRDGSCPTCPTCAGAQSVFRRDLGGYGRCQTCDGYGVVRS